MACEIEGRQHDLRIGDERAQDEEVVVSRLVEPF